MRTTSIRCINCGDIYSYMMSGSAIPQHNDSSFCPGCKRVRDEAYKIVTERLNEIPKVREEIWVVTEDVTYEELVNDMKRIQKEMEDRSLLPIARRVMSELSKYIDGRVCRTRTEQFNYKDNIYITQYWSNDPDNVEIKVKRDLLADGSIVNYETGNRL